MDYDKIINCPKSGGDLCYVIEVTKDITNYYSISCGFWSNSLMKEGTEFYNQQMEILPELYKDLAWTDKETELIWLPHTINEPSLGMVYASGTNTEDWMWAAVKAKKLKKKDQKKYNTTHKSDMSTLTLFKERDYMDALSYINLIP
jgi:hypothetical protein